MSREIEYRAWDSELEIFVDPLKYYVSFDGKAYFDNNDLCMYEQTSKLKLTQYTGLTDVNGVKIFEGDILEEEKGHYFEVCWNSEWAKFDLQWKTIAYQYPGWNRGKKMRVVGNVHEDKHLIEE